MNLWDGNITTHTLKKKKNINWHWAIKIYTIMINGQYFTFWFLSSQLSIDLWMSKSHLLNFSLQSMYQTVYIHTTKFSNYPLIADWLTPILSIHLK